MPTRMLVTLQKERTVIEEAQVTVEVPDDVPEERLAVIAEERAWDALRDGQAHWTEIDDDEGNEVFVDIQIVLDEDDDE